MNPKQLMLALLVIVFGSVQIQAAPLSGGEEPLIVVLEKIGNKYEVIFSYNTKDVKNISVQFELKESENLETAVNRVLFGTNLKFKDLGSGFFVVYKDNKAGKRRFKKIQRKINQIGRLGKTNDLSIKSNRSTNRNIFDAASELNQTTTLSGKITDEFGEGLIGATVLISGTTVGTSTDLDGNYQLNIPDNSKSIEVTYTGFSPKQVAIQKEAVINVELEQGIALKAVTVFGSRGTPRTSFDSPVPVDHISINTLKASGKSTLDQQLMFRVPSYNSTHQPVSDAGAHFNPADLRGLLPSRTLVLINGKRKNNSALVYSYVTAGRGEVGVDMQAISPDAIERVEILRDGAAAQYGSDAVAGVINLVLKKKTDPFVNLGYSTTQKGDGTQYNVSTGLSSDLFDKGYANFTLAYSNQRRSQRAGKISSPEAEEVYWEKENTVFSLEDFDKYLERNPSAGGQIGLPDKSGLNFSFNSGYSLDKYTNTELYAFGTIMSRRGSSPQFARTPYWVTGFESVYPNKDYFLPEMSPRIIDNTLGVGIKTTYLDWDIDLSSTLGRNRIGYYITNSFNQSLGAESPKDFYNGAHIFAHIVNNIDAVRTFKPLNLEALTLAIGGEQRTENFKTKAGEFASYGDGSPDVLDRIGSESFSGFKPESVSSNNRNNLGFYTEINADFTKRLLVGGAIRLEHYSDFGNNLSWKVNARFKETPDRLNFRASVSNGFRAPALHQIYYTATTTTLAQDGIVQNRILNNLDPALKTLGIPKLQPETSFNFGGGFTYQVHKKIGLIIDLYHIKVKDRIVLSGQVGKTDNIDSPIDQFLNNINTASAGFFLNAVNSTTKGVDLIVTLEDTRIGNGNLKGSIAANFNRTTVDKVKLPNFIEENDLMDNILSREDISRIESWRPKQKVITTATYSIKQFSTNLSLFYYGSVSYLHPKNMAFDATYGGKMLTDISCSYEISDKLKLVVGANNIFNVYPDTFQKAYGGETPDHNLDFVGRFKYPWQTTQFGIDGTRFFSQLNFNF